MLALTGLWAAPAAGMQIGPSFPTVAQPAPPIGGTVPPAPSAPVDATSHSTVLKPLVEPRSFIPVPITPKPPEPLQSVPALISPAQSETSERGLLSFSLPAPSATPLAIDPVLDPILQLDQASVPQSEFRDVIANAVGRNPTADETRAQRDEARGARAEARAGSFPVVDASITNFQTLSRAFSNDPDNIIERSQPEHRTDATLHVQQTVYDFGTSSDRVEAADRRLSSATFDIADSDAQVALQAITAWYDVFGYQSLVRLSSSFIAEQAALRANIEQRISQGVSAVGDVAQVDSDIASTQSRVAEFRRSLSNADARYEELTGARAPGQLGRAPLLATPAMSLDAARLAATQIPSVSAAGELAHAAGFDAKASHGDYLPKFTVGVDAGRYGVIETARDYDVRGNVALTLRLGGGAIERAQQAGARAREAEAHYRAVRENAVRDAAIAWSDVAALDEETTALRASYIASRQSRDVLAERFRVSRGTLFDLMTAQNNYFQVATQYIIAITQLDTARYALLARTGKLLDTLGIATTGGERE